MENPQIIRFGVLSRIANKCNKMWTAARTISSF
jgi:hypothetical protein